MRNLMMMASAAAMAIAMPALAQNNGKGNGKGGGKPESAQSAKPGKGNGGKVAKARGNGQDKKRFERAVREDVRENRDRLERVARIRDDRDDRWDRDGRRDRDDDRWDDDRRDYRDGRFADRDGRFCPPGLAKKGNGCMPPGQAKKIFARGERLNSDWYDRYNLPSDYRSLYSDNDRDYYRYDDNGYIYRVNRDSNLVSGLIPLLGGGFSVGQPMPLGYSAYNLPMQYRDTYYDSDDGYYRYGDNAIYQVDPQSGMIESVVALLTGDTLGIGQTMPSNYDVYNVPYDYRDQYADNDQYMYRYADGNIYQADIKTQIITAIISALV